MKLILSRDRVALHKGRFLPKCGFCGKAITSGYDMHEAIITRGNVRGNKRLLPLIMVRENCALVHHGDCHKKASTKEGQKILVEHLLDYEGYEAINIWLDGLAPFMTTDLWRERGLLVTEVYNGL